MATYVIGDLQGCYDEFMALLAKIQFSDQDTLWLVGDLVNRGRQSLAVLRFLKNFQGRLQCVLGNHDLHLLACAQGVRPLKPNDTFQDILTAPDRDALLFWLRQQPFMHYDAALNTIMAHAGIYPFWSFSDSLQHSQALHELLISDQYEAFMDHLYGDVPHFWSDTLTNWPRYRFIVNAFTRMRVLNADESLNFDFSGPLSALPSGCTPWFNKLSPEYANRRIVFGHWAALHGETGVKNIDALDTGCAWGNGLTAQCLESNERYFISATTTRPQFLSQNK